MKKLPKIYQANITKEINNNKKKCIVSLETIEDNTSNEDLTITLEEIFSGIGYSYNIPINIKTQTKVYTTSLIAKTKKNIITIDNEVIPISEIISIQKKKN